MKLSLEGKTAVVTGAAKGIGRSIAERLAESGAAVGIIDFDKTAGLKAQEEMKEKGYACVFAEADVSDYDSMVRAKEELENHFGKIDILVINAGVSRKHTIAEIDAAEWDRVLAINLSGSFYTVKAFYDCFAEKTPEDEGRIIFITSGSGITGTGGGAHYAASKSGQHGLMRTVSKEFGKNGVNVNAIAPGYFMTDPNKEFFKADPGFYDVALGMIPVGKMGNPEQLAGTLLYLSSSASDYVHGSILIVDGGYTVW